NSGQHLISLESKKLSNTFPRLRTVHVWQVVKIARLKKKQGWTILFIKGLAKEHYPAEKTTLLMDNFKHMQHPHYMKYLNQKKPSRTGYIYILYYRNNKGS